MNTNQIEFEPESGSTQIATTVGTYIKSTDKILRLNPNTQTVLDYGAGLGLGADAIRNTGTKHLKQLDVDTLEVNPNRWQGKNPVTYTSASQINKKYDAVICLNVLNVLTPEIRKSVVSNIGNALVEGGIAIISARKWNGDISKHLKYAKYENEQHAVRLPKMLGGVKKWVYQKGFDNIELVNELKHILGSSYDVKNMTGIGSGVCAIVTKKETKSLYNIFKDDSMNENIFYKMYSNLKE